MKLSIYQHYKGDLYIGIDDTPFLQSTNGAPRTSHVGYYSTAAEQWNVRSEAEFEMFAKDANGNAVPRFRRIVRPEDVHSAGADPVIAHACRLSAMEVGEKVSSLHLTTPSGDTVFVEAPTGYARSLPIGAKFRLTLERID